MIPMMTIFILSVEFAFALALSAVLLDRIEF